MDMSSSSNSKLCLLAASSFALGLVIGYKVKFSTSRPNSKSAKFQTSCGDYLVGVDIGGSAVKLGIVNQKTGKVVSNLSENIADKSLDGVCALIVKLVGDNLKQTGLDFKQDIRGIGVCVPGMIDSKAGEVTFAANFPDWPRPAPLADKIEVLLGIRPRVENDANVALLAEIWQGAAKGASDAVMLTLGTGVGSAIVCDGKLLRGHQGLAGEVGHCISERNGRISKNTGVRGIVEEYVSARAVGLVAQDAVRDPANKISNSKLFDVRPVESITSKHVFDLAKQNDELACEIVKDTVDILGVLCINMVRVFDTNNIIFGGGLIAAGDILLDGIRRQYKHHHWTLSEPNCSIDYAKLGTQSGMIGAAFLVHPDTNHL